jgi:hypothetical protein
MVRRSVLYTFDGWRNKFAVWREDMSSNYSE